MPQSPPKRNLRPIALWGMAAAAAIAGIFGLVQFVPKNTTGVDVSRECVAHGQLGMHIHSHLEIIINGGRMGIPANAGITSDCMRPVHTHDTTNQLHVEWVKDHDFTLGDFFRVWGKTFNRDRILDYKTSATHVVTLTVNGVPSQEYEKLTLRDNDKIVIEYKKR